VSLQATIGLRIGALELDVELSIADGEVVALLGPNGAGKSTVLRALAGLLAIEHGRITIDGTVVDDPSADVFVPTERRAVGVVFQDYLLFSHLSALENVAFGLRARQVPKDVARATASEWLQRVGLADHAHHRPGQLSGGQSQRVAIARALATEPSLLLLDEPLAALDAGTRGEVRRDLRRQLAATPGMRLLVTHDPVDAYALADRVVVLDAGKVVQTGTLADVTAHPRSRYVADLVGVNLLRGELADGVLTTPSGGTVVTTHDVPDGPAFMVIRPQSVAVHLEQPSGSPRNAWPLTVADIDRQADRVRIRLDGAVPLVAEITEGAFVTLRLGLGDRAWAAVKATETVAYPA